MKKENVIFSKCSGEFFTWYGCVTDKNSYDIVSNNRTGETTFLTNGIEGEMCNVHTSICKHLKLTSIKITILKNGIVKELTTINGSIKHAIKQVSQKNSDIKLLAIRLTN